MSNEEYLNFFNLGGINTELFYLNKDTIFWVVDLEFRILKFNTAFEDVLFDVHSMTLLQGESILELNLDSDLIKKWEQYYVRAFNGEDVVLEESIETEIQKKHNQKICIKPLRKLNGSIIGAYCSVNDSDESILLPNENRGLSLNQIVNYDEAIIVIEPLSTSNYNIVYANKNFLKLARIENGIEGKNLINFIIPTDAKSTYLKIDNITENCTIAVWQGNVQIGSCLERAMFRAIPVVAEQKCKYLVFIISKLFSQVKKAAILENNKHVFYKALQFSNDIIFTLNEFGVFILVSDAVLHILGYQPQEISGTNFIDYVHESDIVNTKSVAQIIQTGANYYCESKYLHKNGSIVNMLWSATWDADAKLMYCIGRNITDYKEIITKTQETQDLLNEAQRFSKMGSWNFYFKENLLTWSDALYDVFETNKNIFMPSYDSFFSFVIDEDQHFVRQTIKKCATDGAAFTISYRINVGDGKKRIIEAFGSSEKDAAGNIIRLFGTAQDITERRKIARLLEKSNQKYEYLFQNNPLPLYIFDFETLQIIDCNIEALLLYRYDREAFLKLTILDIRPEEDKNLILEATSSAEKYGTIHKQNWRHQKSNGEIFFVEVTGHLIEYEGKKCSFVLIFDITEKLTLEKKEKEHTQFIETTLENLPIGIAVNTIEEGTATIMNQKFSDIYGWPKEILADYNTFYKNVYPDKAYRESIIQNVVNGIQSKDATKMSWEGIKITTQTGENRIINAKNIAVYDQNLMMSVVVDVTEKYNFQKSLEESNERYQYASKATSDAIWDWDLKTDELFWGEGIKTLFGFANLSNSSHSSKTWYNLIHPDDFEIVNQDIVQILKSSAINFTLEHRVIMFDGSTANVIQKALVIRDVGGRAIRLVGAIKDVSHRKAREQQLKLFESVVKNANDAVVITEAGSYKQPDHKIVFVNEAFTKMTGYNLEEIKGKNPRFLQGPKSNFNELLRLRKAVQAWQACEITTINYDKHGNEFWVDFAISPVANEKGLYTHCVSIQRDVTNIKIEEQKRLLINEVSSIFNKSTSLQEAASALLKRISTLFDYPLIGLWLLDDDTETLNLVSYNYSSNSIITTEKFLSNSIIHQFKDKKNGILGVAWTTGKIIRWSISNREFPVFMESDVIASGIKKMTAVPILFNATVIGAMLIAEDDDRSRYNDKIIVSEEISYHLGTEIKRKQLEQELSKIFNFSPDMVCVINTSGKFKRVNPAGCTLFGYNEDELLQMNIIDLVHPDDFTNARKKILIFIKKEQTGYFESRFITRSGSIIWMVWTASSTEDGYIYSIGKDITDRKKAENQLKILNENLIKQTKKLHISNEELEQFAYVASHDLQEPLRMVTSFLTLIEKKYHDKLDVKGLEYIKFAVEGAKNMRQIILDLLHFSRIADNDANYENIELSEIISDVCLLQSKLITDKKAEITFDKLPVVFSIRHYLLQLLQNLIGNALKYGKTNVPVQIKITSKNYKTYYEIAISDNGIGIEQEYFDKIFVLFQRLHRKDEYQGNGMGLAITKKIMDKLNGKIWVTSEMGVGSTFYITIPKKNKL